MKKEVFYLLGAKGDGCDSFPFYTKADKANLPWRCKNCSFPLDNAKQMDIRINESAQYMVKQRPYTFPRDFITIKMIWEPFIRGIPAHILDRDMIFGNVIGSDGKRIEGWLTYHCRYQLFLRGTGKGGTRVRKITVCKDCGFVRWFSLPKHFLYPAPPEDADIFLCGHGTLFRESVYQYLDMEQWRKKVYVMKLTVADEPLDGLDLPPFEIPRDLKWVAEHPELERW